MKNTSTSAETKSSVGFSAKTFEELYVKSDFKGAASYLIQNKQQLNSGIFHYNLGTVYSKMGDYAAARFHLEKAMKEGLVNSSTVNNLNFVKTQLQVDDLSTSQAFSDQAINTALAVPLNAYLTLSLMIMLSGLFWSRVKKKMLPSRIIFVVLLALVPFLFSKIYIANINYAIALKESPVYEGPSKIFAEKGKVRAGSKIILGDFKEGWFYVKYPVSLAGWISKDQLGIY